MLRPTEAPATEPAETPTEGHTPERGSVLLLVDDYPTMQVWSSALSGVAADVERLGLGTVIRQPIGLDEGSLPALAPSVTLILVVSDGASPAWASPRAARLLWALGHQRPTAVLHLLSQPQWYRTGVAPDPAQLRCLGPGNPNTQWEWRAASIGTQPDEAGDGELGDIVPVPVVESSPRWLEFLARLVNGEGIWISIESLLLAEPADAQGPAARPAVLGDLEPIDPRVVVDTFKASVPPVTFRLATYLAAVPLDVSVMQEVRSGLLPKSDVEHLAQVLVSPLVRAESAPAGKSLRVGFRFAEGVPEELLAAARFSDIERLVRVVDERRRDSPGVSSFTSVLNHPPVSPSELEGKIESRRDQLEWRRARARVLVALGGPYQRQGRLELESLPSDDFFILPRNPREGGNRTSPGGSAPWAGGAPMPSDVQDSQPAGTSAPSTGARVPGRSRGRAVLGDYPLRNPNFTGRGDLLADLHASLRSEEPTAVLPHALHGMGGVGKTMLAIEYIYRHQDEYDVVWWIPSQRATVIQSSLIELGQRLGLDVPNEANVAVPIVLDALRRGEPYGNWLLVFDNAESPEQVQPFLPKGGDGHILITSRDARWSQLARPLEVDVFTRDESKDLLQRRGPDITDDEADRLAEALGDLPLAIEQAAAWHYETGMPARQYLQLLREKQIALLEMPGPLDYQTPVIAAWNVSLDHLEARSPEALQLLQVCAFFAAEPIPRALFTPARREEIAPELDTALRDPIRFSRALREISKYSLARIDHRTNAIQMHRLVQAALIARMTEAEQSRMRNAAHRVLAVNDPNDPENPAYYGIYGGLYPHLLAAEAISSEDRWVRVLVINEAKYLYRWGDHGAAVELAGAAHTSWSAAYGDDDAQTLEVARVLGFFLFVVGRYGEAAELDAAALAVFRRLEQEGRPNPDGELRALWNVAMDRRVQGEFAEALAIAEDIYERSMRAYGEDEPDTLLSAHDLAVSLRLSGLFVRARDRDESTYERRLGIFGADDPRTISTRLGLLIDQRELGDYTTAERAHFDEWNRAKLALGELNPTTLFARRLLAVAQRRAGHHQAARETSDLVCTQLRSRYGNRHPDTLAAESNLAIDLRQVGELEQAQRLGADIVQRYTQILGPDHPHTLTAQVNLAITHRLLSETELARQLDSTAHEILVRRLGPDHPSSLVAAANLGSDLFAVGDVQAAVDRDLDTWRRLSSVLGPGHPTTLACESNLAIDLHALGRHGEAEQHHQHALAGLRAALGQEHPAVRQAEIWDERANCDLDPMPL
jgi:hypothetical protein